MNVEPLNQRHPARAVPGTKHVLKFPVMMHCQRWLDMLDRILSRQLMEMTLCNLLTCLVLLSVAFGTQGFAPPIQGRQLTYLCADTAALEEYLAERCPSFLTLVFKKNQDVWKKLSDAPDFTVFCPTDDAMQRLGDKKLAQLQDDRNGELAEQIAAFHAVGEAVTPEELFNSGGVITMGGTIDVGRSVVGGFMGIGGKEDGGVTVQGAKVLESFTVGGGIVHEMDSLVSPDLLWRYSDQLRIPGSK